MKIVLLAAGFATRLYPLTRDCPKSLLPIVGRPVLDRILDRILTVPGVERCVLVTNARFLSQFATWAAQNKDRIPIEIVNTGAMTPDARHGAIVDMRAGIAAAGTEGPILVAAGDNLLDFDLTSSARIFETDSSPLLLIHRLREPVPPGRYSEVHVQDGEVTHFREKPGNPTSPWSAICLYFFPPGILGSLDDYLSGTGDRDAPGHFLAWLAHRTPIRATEIPGRRLDIGTPEALEAARAWFRERVEAREADTST